MPEISVTEEQHNHLEGLREHIASEHLGSYGHIRMQDVIEFLLDTYEAIDETERTIARNLAEEQLKELSYQELQSLAADMDGVEASGKADDLRERLISARAEELLAAVPTTHTHTDVQTETTDSAESPSTDDVAESTHQESSDSTDSDESDEKEAEGETASTDSPRLERMMSLLDRHDDVWTRTDSDEGTYEVTLPDGDTETVRTKDDVRALLFKHYD